MWTVRWCAFDICEFCESNKSTAYIICRCSVFQCHGTLLVSEAKIPTIVARSHLNNNHDTRGSYSLSFDDGCMLNCIHILLTLF